MEMILFTADCRGDKNNCIYPQLVEVTNAAELARAVSHDHVCAEYRDKYRGNDNFLCSEVLVMDCDNDHTDDPGEWITPERLRDMIPDVSFATATSRNNMKDKNGRRARPRFHVYFPIEPVFNKEEYAELKKAVYAAFPFFDDGALDAARFIYGTEGSEVLWNEGWEMIADELGKSREWKPGYDGTIHEGSRNNTMSRFAARVLKRLGITERAYEVFLEHAERCDPPLPDNELNAIWASAVKFFRNKVVTQQDYVSPEAYGEDFRSLRPDDFSDIGEAKVLAREYGNELRYTNATDYLRYNGVLWVEDRQMAIGATEEFLDLQLEDAREAVQEARKALAEAGVPEETVSAGGKELEKACSDAKQMKLLSRFMSAQLYLKFVMKRRDYKYIVATQNAAKPMLAIDICELDRDEALLNTPDATYNLRLGTEGRQEHNPGDMITKVTACSPGQEGRKVWLDALDIFFCRDRELIEYVQRVVGIAAIGKVYAENLIIAHGGGANGKSTFWNTVFRVLGTYCGKLSPETLTMGCKHNVKPEMAELKGKRLIIASEMQEGMRLNTATVKQLCSTDEIFAEKKYKDPFFFVPSHTLVLYTNHLPRIGANDDGTWRRLIVIPFNAKIQGDGEIKNYGDYLFDKAGPFILTWIIQGAKKVIDAGYKVELPVVVQSAISAYREENDWMGHFLEECCDIGKDFCEKSGELYQAYRSFCISNGEFIRSTTDFYHALEKAGLYRKKMKQGNIVKGLKLKAGQDFLS